MIIFSHYFMTYPIWSAEVAIIAHTQIERLGLIIWEIISVETESETLCLNLLATRRCSLIVLNCPLLNLYSQLWVVQTYTILSCWNIDILLRKLLIERPGVGEGIKACGCLKWLLLKSRLVARKQPPYIKAIKYYFS